MADVQILDCEIDPIDVWRQRCGIPSDNAAANLLCVHRHTIANMRGRYLTRMERLAMAAVEHKLEPFKP